MIFLTYLGYLLIQSFQQTVLQPVFIQGILLATFILNNEINKISVRDTAKKYGPRRMKKHQMLIIGKRSFFFMETIKSPVKVVICQPALHPHVLEIPFSLSIQNCTSSYGEAHGIYPFVIRRKFTRRDRNMKQILQMKQAGPVTRAALLFRENCTYTAINMLKIFFGYWVDLLVLQPSTSLSIWVKWVTNMVLKILSLIPYSTYLQNK